MNNSFATPSLTAAIVLAAGEGTRMKSAQPKVLHPIGGLPMICHVMETLKGESIAPIVAVIGPGMDDLAVTMAPHLTVTQRQRKGTGHAVLQAKNSLKDFNGDILIVYGDTPLITGATFQKMRALRQKEKHAVVVLGFSLSNPGDYGRLIVGANGLERIVEANDATEDERALNLCNSGIILSDAKVLWELLAQVSTDNAKREYYLTDIVGLARKAGLTCGVVVGESEELLGVNSRAELATAEKIFQQRSRKAAMAGGATLIDPDTVYFSADTKIGRDVEIGPFTVFGPGVSIDDNVHIKGFCHFEGAHVSADAIVGPYGRLRPGAMIGPGAHIGNFVEVKNAKVEKGAKINHLSYVGDARVGAKANVGAGTITANYDGFRKHRTDIGEGVSIGSNTVLVAPITVGSGAILGAGAVVHKDVPAEALAINSSRQENHKGRAAKYRKIKQDEKSKLETRNAVNSKKKKKK
ncbi:MAG TPA: bifunctional UDP-N-acetylglucosamine diphosphorylase/glucosamine-1-phosphate N-acetyltransferase GlmU [Rhodospirillaceae bacterium]|nr:bifunctional UDP-N-acetylglucosamine diphosphorylase/glucosamine-1-phosphate N-acetyltransferase GlmU [Rhodospirillaceae bacterium]